MKFLVTFGGRTREVSVDGHRVLLDGAEHTATLGHLEGTPLSQLGLDGRSWTMALEGGPAGTWAVLVDGERFEVEVLDERTAHIRNLAAPAPSTGGPALLKAPMPGLVVRVLVEIGQRVEAGTSLVVLEAMKMENELKATAAAVVEDVLVKPGEAVEKGDPLIGLGSH